MHMKLVFPIIICLLLLQLINFFNLFTILLVFFRYIFQLFMYYPHLDTNTARYFKMPSNNFCSSKNSFMIYSNAGLYVVKMKLHQKFNNKSVI